MSQKDIDEAVHLAKWINSGRVADWSVSLEGVRQLAYALEFLDSFNKALNALKSLSDRNKARTMAAEIHHPDPGGLY
jgi:hypothetical protein